jgi:hypothetical protein
VTTADQPSVLLARGLEQSGILAVIAGTVSYLHIYLLVELRGQPGWVAELRPLSVGGMIVVPASAPGVNI